MAIGMTARKALWARSANYCAFPDCGLQLTVDLLDGGSGTLHAAGIPVGEEAHIVSGSPNGPRGGDDYPREKIDSYGNLILLCPTHHRLIDKEGGVAYTADQLRKMKSDHEAFWASRKTVADKRFEEVEVRTAALVETWCTQADLQHWESFTWKLNAPVARFKHSEVDALYEQAKWVLARVWPDAYPRLRCAFANYGVTLKDLVNHIRMHMNTPPGRSGYVEVPRPWNHATNGEVDFVKAQQDFNFAVDVLCEISLKLTKAANCICDTVRSELDPLFRFDEGVLIHRVGDGVFSDNSSREEYTPEQRNSNQLYPGIDELKGRVRQQGGSSG
ncbi:HNH endonuclease [Streptomyces atratus]|uniref:HNH endonuclease n=1 Tax=Streptomyces atratus TaxID=1893 RepID=UPI003251F345